jgi:hypothetical protein
MSAETVPLAPCNPDWRTFDLEPPSPLLCPYPADYRIVQACVHEHVHEALICSRHLNLMAAYYPLEEYGCGACLRGPCAHQCVAPVRIIARRRAAPAAVPDGTGTQRTDSP